MDLQKKEGLREQLVELVNQFGSGDVKKQRDTICAKLDELYVVLRYEEIMEDASDTESDKKEEQKGTPENSNAHKEEDGEEMERLLRGGVLKDSQIYVPESVIRNLGIDNGDRVAARPLSGDRYHYTLTNKVNATHPRRKQMDRIVIDEFNDKLYASRTEEGGLAKVDGDSVTFYIHQIDIERFSLKKGDVIDVAYYTGEMEKSRVIWKHNDHPVHQKAVAVTRPVQKTSAPVATTTTQSMDRPCVLLFGSENYSQAYGRRLNGLGMDMVFMNGEDDLDTTMLDKADIVMVVQFHTGSTVNWSIRSELKKRGRTAHFLPSPQPDSVEEQALHALEQWKKNKTA